MTCFYTLMNITLTRALLSTFHNREYNFNAKISTILSEKNRPLCCPLASQLSQKYYVRTIHWELQPLFYAVTHFTIFHIIHFLCNFVNIVLPYFFIRVLNCWPSGSKQGLHLLEVVLYTRHSSSHEVLAVSLQILSFIA